MCDCKPFPLTRATWRASWCDTGSAQRCGFTLTLAVSGSLISAVFLCLVINTQCDASPPQTMTSLSPNRRCRGVNKEDPCLLESTGANKPLDEFTLVQMQQNIRTASVTQNCYFAPSSCFSGMESNFVKGFVSLLFIFALAPNQTFSNTESYLGWKYQLWVMAPISNGSFVFTVL